MNMFCYNCEVSSVYTHSPKYQFFDELVSAWTIDESHESKAIDYFYK